MIMKASFIISMSNNTPENMNRQQRYHEKNRKSAWKKADGIMKKTNKDFKNWLVINARHHHLKKKKIKKRVSQKSILEYVLKIKIKNKEYGK